MMHSGSYLWANRLEQMFCWTICYYSTWCHKNNLPLCNTLILRPSFRSRKLNFLFWLTPKSVAPKATSAPTMTQLCGRLWGCAATPWINSTGLFWLRYWVVTFVELTKTDNTLNHTCCLVSTNEAVANGQTRRRWRWSFINFHLKGRYKGGRPACVSVLHLQGRCRDRRCCPSTRLWPWPRCYGRRGDLNSSVHW